jgi:hypothetical protein
MATFKVEVTRALAAGLAQHFGEVSPAAVLAATDYAVRRKVALHKDAKRHAAGKLASRLYAPRLDNIAKAPGKLATLVSNVHEVAEKLAPARKA